MSLPANTLSDYYERKVAGVCTRRGCTSNAADDSSLCQPHLEDARARTRKSDKKRRASLRAKGCCVSCGKKSKSYRCKACLAGGANNNRASANNQHIPKSARIVEKIEQDSIYGTRIRKRYIGQGKRGRSSREDESARDVNEAIKTLERLKEDLETLRDPTLRGPDRTNAMREMKAKASLAIRFVESVEDRYSGV